MRKTFTYYLLPAVFAVTVMLASDARSDLVVGDSVGIDFGSIAPAASTNFNQFDAFNNSIGDGGSLAWSAIPGNTNLISLDGTTLFPSLDFTVTNSSGQNTSRANVTNGTTGAAPFNNSTVFQDSIISNNTAANPLDVGGFLTFTFSNLDDTLVYDFAGGSDGPNANFDSTFSVLAGATQAGVAQSFLAAPGDGFDTLSGLVTDGSGNLTVTVTRETLHVNASALTLTAVAVAVPEPSSLVLLGLGSLGLCLRRRK